MQLSSKAADHLGTPQGTRFRAGAGPGPGEHKPSKPWVVACFNITLSYVLRQGYLCSILKSPTKRYINRSCLGAQTNRMPRNTKEKSRQRSPLKHARRK